MYENVTLKPVTLYASLTSYFFVNRKEKKKSKISQNLIAQLNYATK